ncbi:MAG: DNA-protecting protein DprA [Candidatus Kerfeldbacteria bacterium]|nr:DNA-protecting protein DprA [Candidatus Kerfeldbacteria bacterium]
MSISEEIVFICALQSLPSFQLPRFHRLMKHFGNAQAVWEAPVQELRRARVKRENAELLVKERQNIRVEHIRAQLVQLQQNQQLELVHISDERYPALLKEIAQPPYLLYCRGDVSLLNAPRTISIVGARKATRYGKDVVHEAVQDLVRASCVTVSGLAFGIDAAVHTETLTANGKTIAVLGSSVRNEEIYPASHLTLAHTILQKGGLLVSEYAPGAITYPANFPDRNRIIAGLTPATLIVEASLKSGSLITARYARESNREVFAVPGSIFSTLSEGTNFLISHGATPWLSCASVTDTLQYLLFNQELGSVPAGVILTANEKHIVDCFANGELLSLDDVIERTGLPAQQCMSIVSSLVLNTVLEDAGDDLLRIHV